MNLDPLSRDLVIRTLYGEAAREPDEGLAAVAHVIRNRLGAGTYGPNVRSVVLAPNQFEPWNTDQGRARMKGLSPDSPEYQRIARIVDGAWGGNVPDPTNGAQFFYAPAAQRALGRQDPAWATPERFVTQIGGHAFYAAPGARRAAAGGLPPGFEVVSDEPQPMALAPAQQPATAAPAAQAAERAAAPQQAPQPAASGLPPGFEVVADQPAGPPIDAARFGDAMPAEGLTPEQVAAAARRDEGIQTAVARRDIRADPNLTRTVAARSALRGAGMGFSDEIGAAVAATAGRGSTAPTWGERYNENLTSLRALERADAAERPTTSLVGNVAGGVGAAIAAPIGAGARTLGELARVGAGVGAVSGFGAGEGVAGRIGSTAVGGAAGAALAPAAELARRGIVGLGSLASAPLAPYVAAARGWFNPDREAARRISGALARDAQVAGTSTPAQMADDVARMEFTPMGRQTGAPVMVADMGGETTRNLMRSAANTSDEAREALTSATRGRYETQSGRAIEFLRTFLPQRGQVAQGPQTPAEYIRSVTPNIDNPALREAVQAASAARTAPLYRQAYQEGDRSIISPNLERLLTAPAVVDAVREASTRGQNRAVAEGMGGFRSAVTVTDDGRVVFNRGPAGVPTYPNLQFWDYVQRNLRDAGETARRAGRNEEAGAVDALRRQLNTELDSLVPAFGQARATARLGFAADDAIEAGRMFARSPTMENREAARALQQMAPQERQAFGQAYMAEIGRRLDEASDPAAFVRSLRTPGSMERLRIVAGPQVAERFQQQLARQDAINLGREFVTADVTPEVRRQIAGMTRADRTEFQRSFGDALIRALENSPDRANTINRMYNSPAARARIEAVFGRGGASEFEAFLRVEGVMQRVNEAANGNSSTARQLIAAGLAGGAAGAYGTDGDWRGMLSGAGAGAAARRYAIPAIDQRVAQRVGELLASNDPAQIQRLTQMAARNPAIMNAIRAFEARIVGQQSGGNAPAASSLMRGVQGPGAARPEEQDANRQPGPGPR